MGAVFFTLILLTGNTMAQAVRERIPELAVLKTIGFSNHSVLSLVLAEAAVLLLIGAVIGLVLAGLVVSAVRLKFGTSIPLDPVGGPIWLRGLLLVLLIGLIVGALPGAARHASAHRRCAVGPLGDARVRRTLLVVAMLGVIALALVLLVLAPWWALVAFVVLLGAWMALTRTGRQTWSVTEVGLATIPQRLGSSSVVIVGIAGVVGVLVALLAMAVGFEATLKQTGRR